MRKLIACYLVSALVLLLTYRKEEPEAAPTPTSVTFAHPFQILMPGDLCDNYQGTLQYWFEEFRKASSEFRPALQNKIEETRADMKEAGCG